MSLNTCYDHWSCSTTDVWCVDRTSCQSNLTVLRVCTATTAATGQAHYDCHSALPGQLWADALDQQCTVNTAKQARAHASHRVSLQAWGMQCICSYTLHVHHSVYVSMSVCICSSHLHMLYYTAAAARHVTAPVSASVSGVHHNVCTCVVIAAVRMTLCRNAERACRPGEGWWQLCQ